MLPGDDFWEQSGIPLEKRTEFIQYLIGKNYQRKAFKRAVGIGSFTFHRRIQKTKIQSII